MDAAKSYASPSPPSRASGTAVVYLLQARASNYSQYTVLAFRVSRLVLLVRIPPRVRTPHGRETNRNTSRLRGRGCRKPYTRGGAEARALLCISMGRGLRKLGFMLRDPECVPTARVFGFRVSFRGFGVRAREVTPRGRVTSGSTSRVPPGRLSGFRKRGMDGPRMSGTAPVRIRFERCILSNFFITLDTGPR
jgi:hypothetical protein